MLVAVIGRWREQRMRISEFTAYSLLFTVLGGGEKLRISVIPDAAAGYAELSVARHPFAKKFAVKFAVIALTGKTPHLLRWIASLRRPSLRVLRSLA